VTALALLVIAAGTCVYLYAHRRHAEQQEAPRRTTREPVDFSAALRPIGGCRPTSAERWEPTTPKF